MTFKTYKFVLNYVLIIILSSCGITNENLENNTGKFQHSEDERDISQIALYQSFFIKDLDIIQETIEKDELNKDELRSARLLKSNYTKILSKKNFTIKIDKKSKYSQELIKLIYESKLPINIVWDDLDAKSIPENLFANKISGFCLSLYEDAISAIEKNMNLDNEKTIAIYSKEYLSILERLKSNNPELKEFEFNSTDSQTFAAEILGINSSKARFKKISSLNPNQELKFNPRRRADFKKIILLIKPKDYKAMIPALRYHGSNNFEYFNFISALEEINNPLQLLDYEDSFVALSPLLSKKIEKDDLILFDNFLERGVLRDWLLVQILNQSGIQSTKIDGVTGSIFFQPKSCTKRDVSLQKITSKLFSN